MKVVWSPLALVRLEEIADFIAQDKPDAARRWAERMFEAAATLAKHPRVGRVVPEVGREDVRELLPGRYRLIYRVEPRKISILTVRPGWRLLDETEL